MTPSERTLLVSNALFQADQLRLERFKARTVEERNETILALKALQELIQRVNEEAQAETPSPDSHNTREGR